MKKIHFTLLCTIMFVVNSHGQIGTLIPSDRRIDWRNCGYPGDIPRVFSDLVNVKDYGVTGNGSTDDHDALQNLINSRNQTPGFSTVLFFPAGTYRVSTNIFINNDHINIVLRGDGSGSTTLSFDDGGLVVAGQASVYESPITAYDQGSKRITISSSIGGELTDTDYVEVWVPDGIWHDAGDAPPFDYVGQIVKVVSQDANLIFVADDLSMTWALANQTTGAKIRKILPAKGIGIEDLKIVSGGNANTHIRFEYAANCWVSGIESQNPGCHHIGIGASTAIEVRGCYLHEARHVCVGGQGYGIFVGQHSTNCLAEDNIIRQVRHSLIFYGGANRNVFGYNYSGDRHSQTIKPIVPYSCMDFNGEEADLLFHGRMPYENLTEGNGVDYVASSQAHGHQGDFNTIFRNKIVSDDHGENNSGHGGIRLYDYFNDCVNFNIFGNALFDPDHDQDYRSECMLRSYNGHYTGGEGDTPYSDISYYYEQQPAFLSGFTWPVMGTRKDEGYLSQINAAEYRWWYSQTKTVSLSSNVLISSNTTWSGPNYVTGNVTVANQTTLTLATSSQITFAGNSNVTVESGGHVLVGANSTVRFGTGSLAVNGQLIADGTSGQITFTSLGSAKWGGLCFYYTADLNSFVRYCSINNANQGIYSAMSPWTNQNIPTIEHNTITNCGDGIYLCYAGADATKPVRFNTIENCYNGIRIEGLAVWSNYVWVTDNSIEPSVNGNGIAVSYASPRLYRNQENGSVHGASYGVKIMDHSYPKFAPTDLNAVGLNRFTDNGVANAYAYNGSNLWFGQQDEIGCGRSGGMNTLASVSDAQQGLFWTTAYISAQSYSTVMANYSYFGSYPPDPFRLVRDTYSSIDYSFYLSDDPAPQESAQSSDQLALNSKNNLESKTLIEKAAQPSSSTLLTGGFATKGIKHNQQTVLLYLAMHHRFQKRWDRAAQVLSNIINTWPDSVEAVHAMNLLMSTLQESKTDTILAFLENLTLRMGADKDCPRFAVYKTALPLLAGAYLKSGDEKKGLETYDRIVNELPNSVEAKFALYSKFAYTVNVQRNLKVARSIFDELARGYPADPLLIDAKILLGEDPADLIKSVSNEQYKSRLAKSGAKISKSDLDDLVIRNFALDQNYPNPFNPATAIRYQLPMNGKVSLKLYDVLGKEVADLVNQDQTSGIYLVRFDASEYALASGVYVYVLGIVAEDGKHFSDNKRMVILK